jgi:hypothetical protein
MFSRLLSLEDNFSRKTTRFLRDGGGVARGNCPARETGGRGLLAPLACRRRLESTADRGVSNSGEGSVSQRPRHDRSVTPPGRQRERESRNDVTIVTTFCYRRSGRGLRGHSYRSGPGPGCGLPDELHALLRNVAARTTASAGSLPLCPAQRHQRHAAWRILISGSVIDKRIDYGPDCNTCPGVGSAKTHVISTTPSRKASTTISFQLSASRHF